MAGRRDGLPQPVSPSMMVTRCVSIASFSMMPAAYSSIGRPSSAPWASSRPSSSAQSSLSLRLGLDIGRTPSR
jgi:hypothetical protein